MAAPLPPNTSPLPAAAYPPSAVHVSPAPPLRPARYTKVDLLTPASVGHNLVLRVLRILATFEKARVDGSTTKIAEIVVGDETGVITLRARDSQVDFFLKKVQKEEEEEEKPCVIVLRNAGVSMYKGHMRLIVNKWGKISSYPDEVASTPSPPADVLGTNDKSSVEYELVKQMAAKEGRESEEDGEGTEA
ncbi:hypothetical protein NSK_007194 [Nannochloropsis salina CCMP1776]|uniref:Single-stranded DNA binding protein Ssb-like OB fold domain-containing protein n=1 Tax=Nannochloropsis salina CCMP1776 TaxID=1027361 RepID=A0A4D9CQN4_9STRA|nr:hypothetical protein NSK_007194 [Nannochloropsis salina CCMP1776]|eukprot:TFJ81472.1 hypothetical protein NSK_007194 [Nannochloropsis salina CCMP1776]